MNAAKRAERASRRARANLRVVAPVTDEVRDPLARPAADPGRKFGRGAVLMITATALHIGVLVAFILGNWISQALAAKEPPKEEPAEMAVLEPEEQRKKETPPPEPEPELEPLPQSDQVEPAFSQPQDATPQPQIGISSDSTVEGGDGPAFQTGDSLAGAMPAEGLAQEILQKENIRADDLVMTGDTVDTQPVPLASNRPPSTPAKARQRGVGGFVVVRMMIGKDGSVQEVKVLQASPPGIFEDKVLEVIPTWRFTPATYKGQPVVMRVDQTIRFEIS
jgi:periplasmic protein TonB